MSPTVPLIIHVIAAGIGAVFFAWRFQRMHLSPGTGALVGAAAGAVGSLIFMLPLNYCTFDPERKLIDAAFGVLLIGLGMAAVLLPLQWAIGTITYRRRNPGMTIGGVQAGQFKGWIMPFVFLAPTLIVLALFLYYPSLDTFRLSTLLARLGLPRTAFVCVDNFTRLAQDANYMHYVGTTLFMGSSIVVLGLIFGLLIALLAYQPIRGGGIYRTLLIWPYAISPVVAGVIFLLLFNPLGIINHTLTTVLGISIAWTADPVAAPWAVIFASVWKSLGYNILFYLAGLQNVPKDIQESASIDGANAVRRFFLIIVPMLSPITFFLIITNITYAFFETFGTIYYLTPGGGPLQSTTTMMYNIYEIGVRNNDLGKSAAQSIVLFAMVIGLTVLQFRTTGERVEYGA